MIEKYRFVIKWKSILANPFFSVLTVTTLGLVFTFLFAVYNFQVAGIVSVTVFLIAIIISVVICLVTKTELNIKELVRYELNKKKVKKAHRILDEAIKKAIDDEEATSLYILKGEIYRQERLYDEAIASYEMATSMGKYENSWNAYYELGILYRGKYGTYSEETMEYLTEAINLRTLFRIKPDGQDIHICRLITDIYEHNNKHADANNWFFREMAIRESLIDINTQCSIDKLFEEGIAHRENGENLNALDAFSKALETSTTFLTSDHIRVGELHRIIGDIYWDNINTSEHIEIAKTHYAFVFKIRCKYLGSPNDATNVFLKSSFVSSKRLADELVSSGDKCFNVAMQLMREDNQSLAGIKRTEAVEFYNKALEIMKSLFGNSSGQAAAIYHKLGLCYKWITHSVSDIGKGLTYLLKTAKIWEGADENKYYKEFSNLFVDIGGLYHMEGNHKEAIKWRLKAYKTLLIGKHTIEELGICELSLHAAYENTNTPKSFERFLAENGIESSIETVISIKELGVRRNEWTVKLKGIEKPFVWVMG